MFEESLDPEMMSFIFCYIQGEKGQPSQEYTNPLSSNKIQSLSDELAKV